MISLYSKIQKDFDFLGLSNFSRDMFIPLVSNFQSVFSAQALMDSFCKAIMSTFIFSLCQRWAFTNYVAYWFSALLHNLHFELTACLSIFAYIALVCNACSWAAVSDPSVSLISPFFNHVQERLLVAPCCSCSCSCFLLVIIIIIIIVVVVVVVIFVFPNSKRSTGVRNIQVWISQWRVVGI